VDVELAQIVALVTHGNAWLDGDLRTRATMADFEASNAAFNQVRSIVFHDQLVGEQFLSVETWLAFLERIEIDRLQLIAKIDNPDVGFLNQGNWGIGARGKRLVQGWYGHWGVDVKDLARQAENPKIVDITYRGFSSDGTFVLPPPELQAKREELLAAVDRAIQFAASHESLRVWTGFFEQAKARDAAEISQLGRFDALFPADGYGTEARRLLDFAGTAWCFGGMGSWNDVQFENSGDQDEYATVTLRLFRAIVSAIKEAADAFEPAAK